MSLTAALLGSAVVMALAVGRARWRRRGRRADQTGIASSEQSIRPLWLVVIAVVVASLFGNANVARYGLPTELHHPGWVLVLTSVAVIVTGVAIHQSRSLSGPLPGVLVAASFVAAYTYVPETDLLLPLAAVVATVVLAGVILDVGFIGPDQAFILLLVLIWISFVDGVSRPATLVATAWLLVVNGLVIRRLNTAKKPTQTRSRTRRAAQMPLPALVAVLVLLIGAGRIAGTMKSPGAAAVVSSAATAGVTAAMVWLTGPRDGPSKAGRSS